MKKVLVIFFVTLGVVFFMLLLLGAYLYVVDPYNLKPLFMLNDITPVELYESPAGQTEQSKESDDAVAKPPISEEQVSSEQEAALEMIGIDASAIPRTISSEQEACFVKMFGSARVEEIKAGAVPTPIEFMRGASCLE